MDKYHKIKTVYKRDPENKYRTLLMGDFALPEFEYLSRNAWMFTEKVNGTNIRVIWNEGVVTFAGKIDRAQLHSDLVARLQERFIDQVARFADVFGSNSPVCLYGEGYGPKIHGGGKYRADQDFVLFDVKAGDWWLRRTDVEDVAGMFGVDVVPIIGHGTLDDMVDITRQGFLSRWGDFTAEGIVARPIVQLFARNGSRIITKIKCKDFARY